MDKLFNDVWFSRHQGVLLWLLNGPAKPISRCLLGIRTCDVPLKEPISHIAPNAFSYGVKPIGDRWQVTTDFRTHPKFARRIYASLKPLWWLCHAFDMGIANPFRPAWNLGFDVLTTYPDPHEEVYTFDGQADKWDSTWSGVRSGNAGGVRAQYSYEFFCGHKDGSNYYLIRHFFLFKTDALTSSATISSATFSVAKHAYSGEIVETTYPANLCLVSTNPASNTNPATTDWGSFGTTQFASPYSISTFNGLSTGAYADMSLNASGLAAISKTGITKFGIRPENDFSDSTAPTGKSSTYIIHSEDASYDPKLVVTYTLAGGITRHMDYYRRMRG